MSKKNNNAGYAQRRAVEAQKKRDALQRRAQITLLLGVGALIIMFVLVRNVLNSRKDDGGNEASSGSGTLIQTDRALSGLPAADRDGYYSAYPEMVIDTGKDYEAIFTTADGDMRFRLYTDVAPLTVNNFVFLANQGFYDNTIFHRVIEGFMAQAGDPSGTGRGGPGYQFEDETSSDVTFNRAGLLAMANSGPGTNGSQFFVTYGPTEHLNNRHTIFGELVEGQDVFSAVAILEGANAGSVPTEILSIQIVEK